MCRVGRSPLGTFLFLTAMLKTYKSKMTALRILVKVRGAIVPIEFHWDLIYPNSGIRGCSFSTDDVELQKAIEAHEFFGRALQPSIWTDDKEPVPAKKHEEPKKEEPKHEEPKNEETPADETSADKTKVKKEEDETPADETPADGAPLNGANAKPTYPDVTKLAEVRAILKEEYGKTAAEVKSNAQVLALINELGLVFPNLK